ncbi:MAG TPA: outer membrane protein transport protein [bacterium]
MKKIKTFLALTLFAVTASSLYANSYNIFGVDSRSTAMGNAYTTLATDPTGLYYNPAAIVNTTYGTTTEFSYLYPYENFEFKGKSLAAQLKLDDASDMDSPYGFSIGGINKVGPIFGKHIAFGVLIHVAKGHLLIKERFKPESEPITLLFEELPYTTIILAGAGYQVNKYLSVGAGVSVLADLKLMLETDMTAEPFYAEATGEFPLNISPYLGILYNAAKYRIGLSYRGEKKVKVSTTLNDDLTGPINLDMGGQHSPQQITIGFSYFMNDSLTMAADLGFVQWSAYTPPWVAVTLGNEGLGKAMTPLTRNDPGLRDTLLPKIGAEYTMIDHKLAVRGGYIFRQSPVPAQTGISNLIDSNTHIISTGMGYALAIMNVPKMIELDMHFQYQLMTKRETTKPENLIDNPAYPGFTARGDIFNAGFTVKFNFPPPERVEKIDIES